jgi:hypothetical protein
MKRIKVPTPLRRAIPLAVIVRAALPGVIALLSLGYVVLAIVQAGSTPRSAHAQTTSVLGFLTAPWMQGDGFYNFDFRSYSASSTNVDWPMRFLFRYNAEIDNVKNAIDGCGGDPSISPTTCNSGSAQHHLFNDNGYNLWDDDGGKKQSNSCSSGAQHMRLYANPDSVWPYDRNYNDTWGFYIFASVHKDFEGGSGGSCTTYYSAEGEEGWWVQRMLDGLPDWYQESNSYYWSNPDDSGHWDLVNGAWHWTQSNGWASYVWVD